MNNNVDYNEQLTFINLDIIAYFIFIGISISQIFLAVDDKRKLTGPGLFTEQEASNIFLTSRIAFVIVTGYFLYEAFINYDNLQKNPKTKPAELDNAQKDIYSSLFFFSGAVIDLDTAYNQNTDVNIL